MTYKIIGDSCLDLTEELKKDPHFQMIPLTLMVGEQTFIDDETFNQKEFIKIVKESPECPKTACPSPEMFKEAYHCEAENIFVITETRAITQDIRPLKIAILNLMPTKIATAIIPYTKPVPIFRSTIKVPI